MVDTPTVDGVPESQAPAIDVRSLVKQYGATRALDDLDLRLDSGQIVGLLGENGCGKTTLLKVLAGVLSDYTGDVRIAGHRPGPGRGGDRVSRRRDTY